MVDHILGFVLAVYPRYLLYLDDFDNWMFGFSGWLAVVGALCCLWRVLRRKAVTSDYALFFALFVFVALFEFMPSQLTFKHYYSHSRIFRYMVFISPVIYLSGAYFLNILLNTNRRLMRALAWGLLIAVSAFGLYQTPKVSYPLCNANKDMRELAAYIRENPFPEKAKIYTDYWRIAQVSSRLHPLTSARNWSYYGVAELSSEKRVEFLNAAADGYLITGGASLPWYSGIDLIISLQRLNFSAPSSWHLLKEIPGSKESWRVEPLRLWKVENP